MIQCLFKGDFTAFLCMCTLLLRTVCDFEDVSQWHNTRRYYKLLQECDASLLNYNCWKAAVVYNASTTLLYKLQLLPKKKNPNIKRTSVRRSKAAQKYYRRSSSTFSIRPSLRVERKRYLKVCWNSTALHCQLYINCWT